MAGADPRHLFREGQQALESGRPAIALEYFRRAAALAPAEAAIPFHEALAHQALSDSGAELAALDRALELDPAYLPALLGKGVFLERTGDGRSAARVYRQAVAAAPHDVGPALAGAMDHARALMAEDARTMEAFLQAGIAGLKKDLGASERLEEAVGILAGTRKIYVHHAEMLHFPQLPAIPFYDRGHFPWLGALEAQTATIRDELIGLLKGDAGGFQPYVELPDNEPLAQWRELNRSPRWNAYYLWKNGARLDSHCARAPRTAAALEALPQLAIAGFAPTAFFSVLAPRTHLPAHAGSTNIRLTAHLPLVLPGPARFRVGNFTRDWREGQAWVFDDTLEHEAWNDADAPRAILIFDVWNPLLTEAERTLAAALLKARRDYYRQESPP